MPSSLTPVVSIIVPCYNYGRYLPATLDSLIAQEFREWECILVDNGSTDNTADVCKEYEKKDSRFRLISRANNGPAAARNTGLQNAAGTFIQFLDSDDLLESGKLFQQVNFLKAHPETDLVYGDVRYFNNENPAARNFSMKNPDKPWMPNVSGKGNKLIWPLLRYNIMTVHAPLFRKSVITEVGGMDEKLRGYEDWDLWLRMALHNYSFTYLPAENTKALVRSHSASLNRDELTMRRYLIAVWWKSFKSKRLPFRFLPFVLFRIEEEFYYTVIDAIRHSDRSLVGGEILKAGEKLIFILLLPFFFPFVLLAWFIRKIR